MFFLFFFARASSIIAINHLPIRNRNKDYIYRSIIITITIISIIVITIIINSIILLMYPLSIRIRSHFGLARTPHRQTRPISLLKMAESTGDRHDAKNVRLCVEKRSRSSSSSKAWSSQSSSMMSPNMDPCLSCAFCDRIANGPYICCCKTCEVSKGEQHDEDCTRRLWLPQYAIVDNKSTDIFEKKSDEVAGKTEKIRSSTAGSSSTTASRGSCDLWLAPPKLPEK